MWACEKGVFVKAGGLHSEIFSPAVLWSFVFLLLFAWFYALFMEIVAICVFFLMVSQTGNRLQIVVICLNFSFFLCFLCYVYGFF